MNSDVERYIKSIKVWKEEIVALRSIMIMTKLDEEYKWRKLCYCFEESNIAIIQPFKSVLGLMFFKGAYLKDSKNVLVDNGPNSQLARRLEFTSLPEIKKSAPTIRAYVKEAIELGKSAKIVELKHQPEALPEELKAAFKKCAKLKKSFYALTPGRQRGYILHFSGAKQSATRASRIEKCRPRILEGKGLNDR